MEKGIDLPQRAFNALLDHLFEEKDGDFIWNDDDLKTANETYEINIVFEEADRKEIEGIAKQIQQVIPEVVQSTVAGMSEQLFKTLKKRWEIEGSTWRLEFELFQERLEERWGEGLNLLRMLLISSREIGHNAARRYRRSKSKAYVCRRFALVRLHARACQVADEIITLMENGFADGAMARWRTLHEIGIVATLIEGGNEDLAQRFVDHNIVEVKKQADDWDEAQVPLGYAPIGPRRRKDIEKGYADVLKRYGQSFRHDYGWAADYIGDKRPTFKKLQAAAAQSDMTTYYKLANFSVHAGARGMFFRLTDMGTGMPIAGRSNAGLVEPGQNTAHALVLITATLLGRLRDMDRLVEMGTLIAMRNAIPRALLKADTRLRRDEAKMQTNRERRRAKKMR